MNVELWDIALLLLGAKIGGSIFNKMQQPSLVGELLAGVVLGSVLGLVSMSTTIDIVANLGLMFLILLTMLSIDLSKIDKEIEKLVAAQAATAVIMFAIIFAAMKFLNVNFNIALIAFAAIFGSSTAISARSLMSIKSMESKEGQAIIGLQIINGIIELLIISAALNIFQYHQFDIEPLVKLSLMIIGTFAVMSRLGARFINWVFSWAQTFRMEEVLLAFTLVMAFVAAGLAEKAGMSSFLGVMLVGMLVSRSQQALTISQKIKELGDSFFIPIFFASLGIGVSISALSGNISLLVMLTVGMTVLRIVSFVLPMLFIDYSFTEALKIGSGLMSMSEYGLWVLSLGISLQILDTTLYSIFVAIFLIVNVLTPFIIKSIFAMQPSAYYKKNWEHKGWIKRA
jgi:Kef-type K+ transport system membrane component KefB